VQAIKPAFSSFAVAVSGDTIIATSPTTGEKSSVQFSNASVRNAAGLLLLGLSNGGRETHAVAQIRPAASGTLGDDISTLDLTTLPNSATVDVTIQAAGLSDDGPHSITLWTSAAPTSLEGIRSAIATALNGSTKAEFSGADVRLIDGRLQLIARQQPERGSGGRWNRRGHAGDFGSRR
jgi:hypothetical protein